MNPHYNNEPVKLYFTPKEVSERLGVSIGMVYILSRFVIHPNKVRGTRIKFSERDIEVLRKEIT